MIIQYTSDLHLEFTENKQFLIENPILPKGEILILAGDIIPFAGLQNNDDFFSYVSDHFEQTYWIPGNHEYYFYDLAKKPFFLNEKIKENVHLVNNLTVEFDKVRILFSTLWSEIRKENQLEISTRLNDFRLIKNGDKKFSTHDYNELHQKSLRFLETELAKETVKKTVVVSHHVPTTENYPAQFLTGAVNEAFTVELKDFIQQSQPDYWIYGHSHWNTPSFQIGKTKLLTNQLGYLKYGESKTYENGAYFKI